LDYNNKVIIDAHTHIDFLSGLLSAPLDFKKKRVALLAEMKANKVDAALVIANFDRTDPRMLTTAQAIRITEGTGNLYPIGSLDILKYTKADLAEHEKWMKTGKIRGIKIYLGY